MGAILLVARRDYFAYVGAWGFWLSLLAGPLIIAALVIGPLFLSRAEPPRLLAILAERPADAQVVTQAFADDARYRARREIGSYLDAAAPDQKAPALAAFDGAPNTNAAVVAARAVVAAHTPQALRAFPAPSP